MFVETAVYLSIQPTRQSQMLRNRHIGNWRDFLQMSVDFGVERPVKSTILIDSMQSSDSGKFAECSG